MCLAVLRLKPGFWMLNLPTYLFCKFEFCRHGSWHTVGQDCQKCKETSSPLSDKQQKTGEYAENIKFRWVFKLNFMFSTFSSFFCCLSTRGPDVSKVRKHYIEILMKS
jgi:hypothetical protein